MDNYNIERLDKPAGARGGIATLITYSVLNNPFNMETLVVRLKHSTGDLTVYHRPSNSITDDVINYYRKMFNA